MRIESALLHVRLNKMLSWSLRSKRLRLKKNTKRSVTRSNVLDIAVKHGQIMNQNRSHNSERFRIDNKKETQKKDNK